MFKTYDSAYQYLCRFTDYERMAKFNYNQTTFNLKRMNRLLECLDNPHRQLNAIHIAGTKGKGSTALILASILKQAGYQVGLFTSPHLVSLQERIQINGEPISKQTFTKIMNQLHPYLKKLKPTFFEIITAIAFLYFHEQKVDWAIMEVGLGGRLDATNVIIPKLSIITRIDFDHTDKLGHTLTKIAREKAGIIKRNVPVIAFEQDPTVNRVFKAIARKHHAPLRFVSSPKARSIVRQSVSKLPFLGNHQLVNSGLALTALKLLKSTKLIKLSKSAIRTGLKQTSLPARIELINRKPLVILDSAHNPVAIQALRDTITNTFSLSLINFPPSPSPLPLRERERVRGKRQVILIISIARDKEVKKILDILIPMASMLIFTQARNPRMCTLIDFIKHTKDCYLPIPIFSEPDSRQALGLAMKLAKPKDLVVITGSFYLAGEIKSLSKLSGNGSRPA